jgi:hypothetical protein
MSNVQDLLNEFSKLYEELGNLRPPPMSQWEPAAEKERIVRLKEVIRRLDEIVGELTVETI